MNTIFVKVLSLIFALGVTSFENNYAMSAAQGAVAPGAVKAPVLDDGEKVRIIRKIQDVIDTVCNFEDKFKAYDSRLSRVFRGAMEREICAQPGIFLGSELLDRHDVSHEKIHNEVLKGDAVRAAIFKKVQAKHPYTNEEEHRADFLRDTKKEAAGVINLIKQYGYHNAFLRCAPLKNIVALAIAAGDMASMGHLLAIKNPPFAPEVMEWFATIADTFQNEQARKLFGLLLQKRPPAESSLAARAAASMGVGFAKAPAR